jgi:exopolysaccharide/PEP-CTERM locus tyrosine autokinase
VSIVEDALALLSDAKRSGAVGARVVPTRQITVDLQMLRAAGYAPEEGQERRFADFYREIKRPLIRKALARGAPMDLRLIMVSSALPGEGKTFITLSLALSMARERDVSVLLVDADLPKAHITRTLHLENEPGLLDCLADSTRDAESLVLGTDVPGLQVLPAGRPNESAAEMITSARMRNVINSLVSRNPHRLVLFDSPPLLVSSEARALIQIPGVILLVARAGHTPRQALIDAIAKVDKNKLHGVVLNECRTPGGGDSYGYYDYDGYGAERSTDGAQSDANGATTPSD